MNLSIVSPLGVSFEGPVEAITVDTTAGQLTILPMHADYLAFFDVTQVQITPFESGTEAPESLWACNGYLHVKGDDVFVIAQLTDPDEDVVRAVHLSLAEARAR